MLSDEDRVPPHRCLATVVTRIGGGEPGEQEPAAVLYHNGPAFFSKIFLFLLSQTESAAELAAGESGEELVEIAHWLSRYRVDRSNCIVSISGLSSATSWPSVVSVLYLAGIWMDG